MITILTNNIGEIKLEILQKNGHILCNENKIVKDLMNALKKLTLN
jgi:hypothetical protein